MPLKIPNPFSSFPLSDRKGFTIEPKYKKKERITVDEIVRNERRLGKIRRAEEDQAIARAQEERVRQAWLRKGEGESTQAVVNREGSTSTATTAGPSREVLPSYAEIEGSERQREEEAVSPPEYEIDSDQESILVDRVESKQNKDGMATNAALSPGSES